jgi:hypothetical protein
MALALPYAGVICKAGATVLTLTGTAQQVTCFSNTGGAVAQFGSDQEGYPDVQADKANNRLKLNTPGVYLVMAQLSGKTNASADLLLQVRKNGTTVQGDLSCEEQGANIAPVPAGQLVPVQIQVSPTGIPGSGLTASTTTVANLTGVTGLLATDILIGVQKPASQAGIFIIPGDLAQGGVTGAGAVTVKYVNVSTGTPTPTASEVYTFTVLRPVDGQVQLISVSPTGIPGSRTAGTAGSTALTGITGLLSTDTLLAVYKAASQAGLKITPGDNAQGGVTGAGAASVIYVNDTVGAITPTGSEVYTFVVLRSFAQAGSVITVTPTGIPTSVVANAATQVALTAVTGILASDTLIGVYKAAHQAGLIVMPGDGPQGGVTADGAVTITYLNVTGSAITPTASENYSFVVARNVQGALVPITVAPTGIPASVLAQTASGVALTGITGLQANDTLVSITKAAGQAGLKLLPGDNNQGGVTGAAAATVVYMNDTVNAITPTAGENYTFTVLRQGDPAPAGNVGRVGMQIVGILSLTRSDSPGTLATFADPADPAPAYVGAGGAVKTETYIDLVLSTVGGNVVDFTMEYAQLTALRIG